MCLNQKRCSFWTMIQNIRSWRTTFFIPQFSYVLDKVWREIQFLQRLLKKLLLFNLKFFLSVLAKHNRLYDGLGISNDKKIISCPRGQCFENKSTKQDCFTKLLRSTMLKQIIACFWCASIYSISASWVF